MTVLDSNGFRQIAGINGNYSAHVGQPPLIIFLLSHLPSFSELYKLCPFRFYFSSAVGHLELSYYSGSGGGGGGRGVDFSSDLATRSSPSP